MTKILVVDDDAIIRSFLEIILKTNHTIIQASNGQEGLETFIQQHPDLIIADWQMPVMNGLDMVKAIRALDKNVLIIGHSSFPRPHDQERFLAAGADACCPKPIEIPEIQKVIDQLLKKNSCFEKAANNG